MALNSPAKRAAAGGRALSFRREEAEMSGSIGDGIGPPVPPEPDIPVPQPPAPLPDPPRPPDLPPGVPDPNLPPKT